MPPEAPSIPAPPGSVTAEQYDKYIKTLEQAMAASAGFARQQLQAQINDAKAGRENALQIARLTAETSRYGIDVQSRDRAKELLENQRQFDARHGLEMQRFGLDTRRLEEEQRQFNARFGLDERRQGFEEYKFGKTFGLDEARFGLDRAKAYTEYASTPDRTFMLGDLQEGLARAGQGLGPTPYATTGAPVAKGWDDFAVLSAYGTPATAPVPAPAPAPTPAPTPAPGAPPETPAPAHPLPPGHVNPYHPSAVAAATAGRLPADTMVAQDMVTLPDGRTMDRRRAIELGLLPSGSTGAPRQEGMRYASGGGGQGTAPDPRIKAVNAILQAVPPSATPGYDHDDYAVLQSIGALIRTARPDQWKRLRPGQREATLAGARRMGYYAPDVEADIRRRGIGQGSVRMG